MRTDRAPTVVDNAAAHPESISVADHLEVALQVRSVHAEIRNGGELVEGRAVGMAVVVSRAHRYECRARLKRVEELLRRR